MTPRAAAGGDRRRRQHDHGRTGRRRAAHGHRRPYGQRSELALDAHGFLASVSNPAGETVLLTNTAGGLLTGMTTPRDHSYAYSYDLRGRLLRDDNPTGGFKALERVESATTYSVTLTTALSRTTTYEVQNLPTGDQRRVNTDPAGLDSELVKGTGDTRLSTDLDGTVRSATLGPDPRWSMQAPALASASLTTPGGLTVDSVEERSVVLADPDDLLSLVSLDQQVTVNGRVYASTYLSATHRFTETSPAGRQLLTTIDDQSRPVQVEAPGLLPVQFGYDERGRPATIVQGSRVVSITYNSEGYPSLVTDPLGRSTSFAYDDAGRVVSQTLPGGRTTGFSYDANGNLTGLTPPGRPVHSFTYTPLDLASAYIPPDVGAGSNQTGYTYNPDRQLTQVSRPDGQTIDLAYDAAGRLQGLDLPGRSLSLGYHPTSGNLDSIGVSGGVSLTYAYDGFLPTGETWSGAITGTVTRTYDSDLRVATLGVNGGTTTAFAYDDDSMLTQAGAMALDYHPQTGLLTGTSLISVTTAYGYNGYGELIDHGGAYNGASLHDVQLTRDDLGRITGKSETIGGVTTVYSYAYDLAGHLVAEIVDGEELASYSYDLNGNRLSVTRPGGVTAATYDDQDRLLSYGAASYTYTANGELSTKAAGGQTTTYTYDALGNLLAVDLPSGTAIEYLVDGRNRRVGRRVNGVLAQGWLYQDQLAPIAELDSGGNLAALFIYAMHGNVPDVMIKAGVTYRLLTDHLGSVRLVVDAASGLVAQRLDFDAFGRVLADTNPGFQPFGFAGGLYDPLTGLVRFGARDYDAEVGRWTAKDPIGFGGGDVNLFGYVISDPVNKRSQRSTALGSRLGPKQRLEGPNA
ncbi:MAG: RHS repeat-associated core domain-containing protein [Caldilineales bacterium]